MYGPSRGLDGNRFATKLPPPTGQIGSPQMQTNVGMAGSLRGPMGAPISQGPAMQTNGPMGPGAGVASPGSAQVFSSQPAGPMAGPSPASSVSMGSTSGAAGPGVQGPGMQTQIASAQPAGPMAGPAPSSSMGPGALSSAAVQPYNGGGMSAQPAQPQSLLGMQQFQPPMQNAPLASQANGSFGQPQPSSTGMFGSPQPAQPYNPAAAGSFASGAPTSMFSGGGRGMLGR